jgi:PhnB protein
MNTSTHLHFNGNCREAFDFYAQTFGGRIVFAMTYAEAPTSGNEVPADTRDKIIHARIDLGDQFLLGCDTPAQHYHAPQGFNVMAAVEKPAEAERIFNALAAGGAVTMAFQETFWAHRFGMCTDRFGVPWMVNCEKPLGSVAATARKSA